MAVPKQRTIETMSVSESRKQYSELLNRVFQDRGRTRIGVERSGTLIGAIVSPRDLAILEAMDAKEESQLAALDRYQAAFAGIPDLEIEIEIARVVEEAEIEIREERIRTSTES